jgi:hypothetical protein
MLYYKKQLEILLLLTEYLASRGKREKKGMDRYGQVIEDLGVERVSIKSPVKSLF